MPEFLSGEPGELITSFLLGAGQVSSCSTAAPVPSSVGLGVCLAPTSLALH